MKMSGLPFCLFIFYRPNEWSLIMIFSLKMGIEAIEMKDTQSSLDWNKFRPAFFFFKTKIIYICIFMYIPLIWFKRAFYIYFLKTSSSYFFFLLQPEWNGNTNLLLRRHNQSDSHSNIFLARDFYISIFFFSVCLCH